MSKLSLAGRVLLPVLAASVLPALLAAQSLAMSYTSALRTDPVRAEALHEQATREGRDLESLSGSRLRRLADLHLRSASLRSPDDAHGIECLRHAANLLHVHDPSRAAELESLAADRALASGRVLEAAHGYVNVAALLQMGIQAGKVNATYWVPRARQLVHRAEELAASPHVAEADRAVLLARIAK